MKLALEIFSHRSGEAHLNSKIGLRQEIETALLKPRIDITTLSRDQFVDLMKAAFMAKGWDNPPAIVDTDGDNIPLMEFIKDHTGIEFAFNPAAILPDMMKFQSAYTSRSAKIDVGVYIVGTTTFQSYMRSWTGRSCYSITFHEVVNYMPIIGPMIKVPLCLIGLDVIDFDSNTNYRNINMISTAEVKDIIIDFLESKYGRDIKRDVRVKGMGKGMDVEFDAVMTLKEVDIDILIELEVSAEGILNSRILADDTRSLNQTIEDYKRSTGRDAQLWFFFFGNFPDSYIQDRIILKQGHELYADAMEGIIFETFPLEDIGLIDT